MAEDNENMPEEEIVETVEETVVVEEDASDGGVSEEELDAIADTAISYFGEHPALYECRRCGYQRIRRRRRRAYP